LRLKKYLGIFRLRVDSGPITSSIIGSSNLVKIGYDTILKEVDSKSNLIL